MATDQTSPDRAATPAGGLVAPTASGSLFVERRAVPWWYWVLAIVIVVPSIEAVVVLGPEMTTQASWLTGAITLVVTLAVIAFVLISLSAPGMHGIAVTDEGLRAGKALLPASAVGRVRQLDAVTARVLLGRDARADAQLSIRPWIHTAVQIEVVDAFDSTPYWIVGTRRAAELVGVLHTLRSVASGDADLAGHAVIWPGTEPI